MSTTDVTLQARALPREIEPPRDLWPGIEARLDSNETGEVEAPGNAHRWRMPLALVAALVLAGTVGYWVGGSVGVPQPATVAERPVAGVQHARLILDTDLHQTRLALTSGIESQLATLPPETRALVADNLNVINQALDEIDDLLRAAPDSDPNSQLLMAMYADQLALMSAVSSAIRAGNQEILL